MKWFLIAILFSSPAFGQEILTGKARGEWVSKLQSVSNVRCCDDADGEDVYWESSPTADSGYKIVLDGIWYDVPKEAIVNEPNRIGKALVWVNKIYNGNVKSYMIRCFLPGAAY